MPENPSPTPTPEAPTGEVMGSAGISRRVLLQAGSVAAGAALGGGAATVGATAATAATSASAPVTVQADGITLVAETDGSILIRDTADRVRIGHFMIKDSVLGQQRTFGGTPSAVTVDGKPAIQVDYTMSASAQQIKVRGLFSVAARRAHLRWEVSGSTTLTPSGFMFARTVLNPSAPERYVPATRWTRDPRGGVPYEINSGALYQSAADVTFRLAKSTPTFTNATWIHAPAVTGNVTEADVVLGELRPAAVDALATGRLGVEAWSAQPFGLYGQAAQTRLEAEVANGTDTPRAIKLTWTATDFDGKSTGGDLTRTLQPAEVWHESFTVQGAPQGILFCEVTAGDAFARTNLATLKPHTYQPGGRFGIANYTWLLVPGKAEVGALLQKIGANWVRIAYDGAPGPTPKELDGLGIKHNVQLGGVIFNGTPEQITAWADERAATAKASGAAYFEVGNELNNPWMQGQKVPEYIRDGLKPIHDRLKDSGIKLMNCGLGGMDTVWTAKFKQAGGWDLIDAFAFHPGRGNFTPDYAPKPEEWQQGENGSYWNFLGALREARRVSAGKELWLTEAYACTRPNRWWNDNHRQAAENVLLSLALAVSEGVTGVNWYQPHDSTIHHPQEADPDNAEYHFGLMNRDTSVKAALLAYATATRTLEGAKFVKWLTFKDPAIKGLLFDKFAILWTRKDGYFQNSDHGTDQWYPHKEAWVDHWPTKTKLTLPAKGANVHVVDCIGRETWVPVQQGGATLTLDGAPRIYYGLA